jgi:exosortase
MTPAPRIPSSGGMTPPPRTGREPVTRSLIPSPKAALVLAALGWVYWPTIRELFETWTNSPEYSHGLLVPFFALFLLAKSRTDATGKPWPILGFIGLTLAIFLRFAGAATSFLPLEGLSLILCLTALVVIAGGAGGLRRFWMPLVFLVFMVPLPYEASRLMGAELQRVGTLASTFLLQCFGQPAIAEGNRILVESVTLNVVEACSGLRMLVTFIAFSVAAVMLLDRHWVVKGIVLASAVPIALVTNVLRITATGLGHVWLEDGERKTRVMDFAHDFNGWMMMPVGLGFLVFELWVLKHLLIERPAPVRPPSAVPAAQPAPASAAKPRFASVIQIPVSR